MAAGDLGFVGIVGEGVGVIAERGNLDFVFLAECANVVGLSLGEVFDIDVAGTPP